ncbi:MAG: hypothetical protein Q8P50_02600 [Bacillota bacterium]|nr:hypothetical protein [Bacillota bacterium]
MRHNWPALWLAVQLLVALPLGGRVLSVHRNLKAAEATYEETCRQMDRASRSEGTGPPNTDGMLAPTGEALRLLFACSETAGVAVRTLACSGVERNGKLSITVGISAQNTESVIAFLREVGRCLPVSVSLERLDFFDRGRDVSVRLDWTGQVQGQGR